MECPVPQIVFAAKEEILRNVVSTHAVILIEGWQGTGKTVTALKAVKGMGDIYYYNGTAGEIPQCYDQLQERVDVCEAALHIDLKDAAQIIYDAVWADPSDPSKTYTNAASSLLTELRKRAGVSSMIGPFQPLGN